MRKDLKMLLVLVVGVVGTGLYSYVARYIDKRGVLAMEFNGMVSKVKYYRANNIDVIINKEEFQLRAYGLYVVIDDGYMKDGDEFTTYKQSCIIDAGDSLIKKKGEYPILLIKKNKHTLHLQCKYEDSGWF